MRKRLKTRLQANTPMVFRFKKERYKWQKL